MAPVRALHVGWRPDKQPGDIVVDAARRYELRALLVHSTSWRFEDARVPCPSGSPFLDGYEPEPFRAFGTAG